MRASVNRRRMLYLVLALTPSLLQANTGAPILLSISFPVFILGFGLIVAIEGIYIWKLERFPLPRALADSFWVNLYTTFLGGIALPIVVSVIGYTCYMWPTPRLQYFFSYFGTMAYRGHETPFPSYAFALAWLGATFLITVYLEAHLLAKRWTRRNEHPPVPSLTLSWRAHTISYSVLFGLYSLGYSYLIHHGR